MTPVTGIKERLIAIVAMPDTMLIDIAGPADVFSRASIFLKSEAPGKEPYKVLTISPEHGKKTCTSLSGISINTPVSYKAIDEKIDTLIIAGYASKSQFRLGKDFYNWLDQNSGKIRRIASICRGTFALAEAGLLKGKRATTHWMACNELQAKYPDIIVDPDPIFIKEGKIYTSAGVSSGMDLALAMVEEDYGRDLALTVAKELVLFLQRPGNQSQFSTVLAQQHTESGPIRDVQEYISEHIKDELKVEQLSEHCAMSPRNFARVFLKETGITPGKYIEKVRLEKAKRSLEDSNLSLDQIADSCGIGSQDSLRRLFLKHLNITPGHYRKSFKTAFRDAVA